MLAVAAGLVLGTCLFLSYGMILMAPIAVAVLVAARAWRPLPLAALAALVPVALFAAAGFWWVEAEQLLVERYYQGKGRLRPYSYWVWGNLAVTAVVLGSAAVAGAGVAGNRLARAARHRAQRGRGQALRLLDRLAVPPAGWLALGAVVAILASTLSGLSKSEVERIWLPFTLAGPAHLLAGRRSGQSLAGSERLVGAGGEHPVPHHLVSAGSWRPWSAAPDRGSRVAAQVSVAKAGAGRPPAIARHRPLRVPVRPVRGPPGPARPSRRRRPAGRRRQSRWARPARWRSG